MLVRFASLFDGRWNGEDEWVASGECVCLEGREVWKGAALRAVCFGAGAGVTSPCARTRSEQVWRCCLPGSMLSIQLALTSSHLKLESKFGLSSLVWKDVLASWISSQYLYLRQCLINKDAIFNLLVIQLKFSKITFCHEGESGMHEKKKRLSQDP